MLKIKMLLTPEITEIETFDFTLLPLRKVNPTRIKGRKVRSQYKCSINEFIVVEKNFVDIITADRFQIEMTINWFNMDGSVGLTKKMLIVDYHNVDDREAIESIMLKRRIRQKSYLVAAGKGTSAEPYLNAMFDHYKPLIDKYVETGAPDWATQVALDTVDMSFPFYAVLNTAPEGAYTVSEAILFQIT